MKRYELNEKYIFGGVRCLRCGKVMQDSEKKICESCKVFISDNYKLMKVRG